MQAAWDWATESPLITCNRPPDGGSTDGSRGRGPEAEGLKEGRPWWSRSRRNRRIDRRDNKTHSPDSEIHTDATDSAGPDLQSRTAIDPGTE